MKITLESTDERTEFEGWTCTVWKGKAEFGREVRAILFETDSQMPIEPQESNIIQGIRSLFGITEGHHAA